jgi:acyl-CoA thioesterase YciA
MTQAMTQDCAADTDGPRGELALRISAMPANTNAAGDIFGGWIMGLMDMAAGSTAHVRANGRVATVAVSNLVFVRPVKVGNMISCYTEIVSVGRTSMTIDVDVWARRGRPDCNERVTKARFVMVAVDANGQPRAVDVSETQ